MCVCLCMHACVHVYACACVCLCVCVCNIPNLQLKLRLGLKVYHEEIYKMESSEHFTALTVHCVRCWGFPVAPWLHLPMREAWVRSLGWEDALEGGMATHSSILAWRIPWTEEPGGLQWATGT